MFMINFQMKGAANPITALFENYANAMEVIAMFDKTVLTASFDDDFAHRFRINIPEVQAIVYIDMAADSRAGQKLQHFQASLAAANQNQGESQPIKLVTQ